MPGEPPPPSPCPQCNSRYARCRICGLCCGFSRSLPITTGFQLRPGRCAGAVPTRGLYQGSSTASMPQDSPPPPLALPAVELPVRQSQYLRTVPRFLLCRRPASVEVKPRHPPTAATGGRCPCAPPSMCAFPAGYDGNILRRPRLADNRPPDVRRTLGGDASVSSHF